MLKESLKEKALSLGFAALGVAEAAAIIDKHTELAGAGTPPFVPWDPCQRCDPETWLPGAKSVLAAAWPYGQRYRRDIHLPGPGKGYLSPFAAAPDYHSLVREKLVSLAEYMSSASKRPLKYHIQVDSGPGCERLWALAAGIGWQGKNNFVIVPGYGSFVWLGLITTDLKLSPDLPQANRCGACERCLKACPTGAYSSANKFEHQNCLAFFAAQKGELAPEMKEAMALHKTIYGCDLCQISCPHNKLSEVSEHQHPDLKEIMQLSSREFRKKWRATAAGWRGKNTLRRNAIIAAAHEPELRGELELIAAGTDDAASLAREALKSFKK